jgi:hypothetical protein
MTAEEKIRFTIAEYCHRTDSGDFDGWVKLFAEDGSFRMFGNEVVGHAALRAFIAQDQSPGDAWLFKLREAELILPVATQRWRAKPA